MKNETSLLGCVASAFTFSHSAYDEDFYKVLIDIKRTSGTTDRLPVLVSEKLMDVKQNYIGQNLYIQGEYRSCNIEDADGSKHLLLSVFAKEIYLTDSEEHKNEILLEGIICKMPVYRKTPLGRQITDVMLAVNRQYGKSDYIPCICWGRIAIEAARYEPGKNIRILGRIQSRQYSKAVGDTLEAKTAYEVSVMKLEVMEHEGRICG